MARVRYEPPHVDAPAEGSALAFERTLRGPVVPWTIASPAANSMPPPAAIAQGELEALRREAREAGRAEAEVAIEAELAALAQQRAAFETNAQASLDALAALRERAIEAWRGELAALAVAIAEALLQRELGQGLPDIEPLLVQALAELDPHERATVTVEPALLESVAAWARARWPAAVVRADAALGPGELRVSAPSGAIDGTRAARLARARALVLGEVDTP
ncbi:MAG: hypothetical protein K1X88_20655 [Nannocystaceae bacterium]|nr:hypothetical protein [Nannocystaceae bacterium]